MSTPCSLTQSPNVTLSRPSLSFRLSPFSFSSFVCIVLPWPATNFQPHTLPQLPFSRLLFISLVQKGQACQNVLATMRCFLRGTDGVNWPQLCIYCQRRGGSDLLESDLKQIWTIPSLFRFHASKHNRADRNTLWTWLNEPELVNCLK